jgi:putative intracellular protease/amidase
VAFADCHGPAGLREVRLTGGGRLLRGKKVTGFSRIEEGLARRDRAVPYNLEEELQKWGADGPKNRSEA